MTTATCGACKRPLPKLPTGAPGPCPQCVARAPAAPRAAPPIAVVAAPAAAARRSATSEVPVDPRRTQAFVSALASNADRVTPVRPFSLPPEAVGAAQADARRAPVATISPAAASPVAVVSRAAPVAVVARAAAAAAPVAVVSRAAAAPVAVASAAAPAAAALSLVTPAPPVPAARAATAVATAPTIVAVRAAPVATPAPIPVVAAAPAAPTTPAPLVDTAPVPAAPPKGNEPGSATDMPSLLADLDVADVAVVNDPSAPEMPLLTLDSAPGGRFGALRRRLSGGGLGVTALSAVLVVGLGVLGITLFAGRGRAPRVAAPAVSGPIAGQPAAAAAPAPAAHPLAAATPPVAAAATLPVAAVVTAPPAPAALPSAAAPAPIAAKAADDDDGADDADEADADASSSSDSDGPRLAPKAPRGKKARLAAKHAAKARGKGGKHVALAAHPSRRRGAVRAGAASDDGSGLDATGRGREAYKRGNERLFSGDAAGAAEAYEEAIHSNPKDPSGYRGLGLAFAQQGKKAEAVRYLKAYLRRGARDAEDRKLISERIQLLGAAP